MQVHLILSLDEEGKIQVGDGFIEARAYRQPFYQQLELEQVKEIQKLYDLSELVKTLLHGKTLDSFPTKEE